MQDGLIMRKIKQDDEYSLVDLSNITVEKFPENREEEKKRHQKFHAFLDAHENILPPPLPAKRRSSSLPRNGWRPDPAILEIIKENQVWEPPAKATKKRVNFHSPAPLHNLV